MPTTTRVLPAAVLAAASLLLSACSTGRSTTDASATATVTATVTQTAGDSGASTTTAVPPTTGTPSAAVASASAPAVPTSTGQQAPARGTLTIVKGGTTTAFTPDIVRCNGPVDAVRQVTITSRGKSPVVTVTPGRFAKVVLPTGGAPDTSNATTGITVRADVVTFEHARIGGTSVTGTLPCLQRNG